MCQSSRMSELTGYPMSADTLRLLDTFLVCVAVRVSLGTVALVVVPRVAREGRNGLVGARAGKTGSSCNASQGRKVNPMVASIEGPVEMPATGGCGSCPCDAVGSVDQSAP